MTRFPLRATVLVALVLLGWWGIALASACAATPQHSPERAALAAANDTDTTGAAAGGIVFAGRCIDAATGAPLANVAAAAYFDVATRDLCDNELAADTTAARVVSGPDGAFRIACERRLGATYDVRVGNREHVHRVRTFEPFAADHTIELGDVALARGVHVSLLVVDRRGAPVPGVRITADGSYAVGRNDVLMLDTYYPWRSDAQGEIHLPYSMLPGRVGVAWWGFDYLPQDRGGATLEVPRGSAEHHAVLVWPVEDLADAISGEVVDAAGNPVADVSIGAEGGGTRGNARTRADGTFRMVRIGPYDANARGPVELGLPPPTCGLELVDAPTAAWGDRGVRLVVRPVATLRVRAVDTATGETVSDVDVACAAHRDDSAAPQVVWSRFSPLERLSEGTVRRRLARCRHDVQVFPQGGHLAPSFKVVWDPAAGDDLVVPLTPPRACTVRVVTMDGEPVAGTELWTLQPIEAVDGVAAAAGWREVALPVADELRLDPTTRWGLHGIDDAPLGTARTGADGRAQVLVPANADVVVAALGPGHVPLALVGRAGGDAEVEIRVVRGASVRFVLTPKEVVQRLLPSSRHARITAAGARDPGPSSVALRMLRIESEPDPQRPEAEIVIPISPDGTCEHRGLRPGRYATALAGNIESGAMDGIEVFWQPGPVSVRDGERNEIRIDVSRWALGRLQCQVLLNGRPWAFGIGHLWSMELVDEQASSAGYLIHVPKHRAVVPLRTDGDGRFDVEAVPGEYQLHLLDVINAAGGGNCCAVEPVHVVAGATRQLVLTARDVTARVRVVDAAGAPSPGLTVTTDYTTVPQNGVEWTTDADGWFTMVLAPPVPFHLVVKNPDGPARAGRRTTSSGDAVLGPFQIPPTGDTAEFRAVLPEGWR
ncbi:MAG TPA: carboxypeptidase-like regulatory domain-containing protein [Planctomycetota bacterium]|nr:carboxypeptidase-like regulatory domain-containing protein [Planctomycetota bacterium]